MIDEALLQSVAAAEGPLSPEQCAEKARLVAASVDSAALDRAGVGDAMLLWRNESSEAWLNTWREPRDTGYHDHDGSCVGVHVLEGVASNEPLVIGGPPRSSTYGAGESFSFPGSGIHRMDHEPGAVTIHVYSPPLRVIGHYDLVDGALQRRAFSPDEPTGPSGALNDAFSERAS